MAAEAHEEAEKAAPSRLRKYGMRTGHWPLVSPSEALTHPEWERAKAMPSNAINGTEEVVEGLMELREQTGASELFFIALVTDSETG